MLLRLKIQNLVLVDQADIHFSDGLNILTGETGAGKSAILSAIRLITGNRAELQLIGKHGDTAVIEAWVTSYCLPEELSAPPAGEPLLIRREIHKSGKSRCFVEENQVSLSLLREIMGASIELIDQSSSQILCLEEEQRRILDTFAGTLELQKNVSQSFDEQQTLQKKAEELRITEETRSRDLAWAEEDLDLIQSVPWEKEEEAALSQEHYLLTHSQEIHEKISSIVDLLENHSLKRASSLLDGCLCFDPSLSSLAEPLRNAALEVTEVQRSLVSYVSCLEVDPRRLTAVEERIANIEQIQRKFGKTWNLVQDKKKECLHKIDKLKNLEEELRLTQQTLSEKVHYNQNLAQQLSAIRHHQASKLDQAILAELRTLNLPHAQFTITHQEILVTSHGCDAISFLFSANQGHSPLLIEECASGGELSRLLLAIKIVLADKEHNHCMIFDEIDSNVGGQTASILGEKLKTIAKKKQVICITHFVQVAKCAHRHFAVSKKEENGKTITTISPLQDPEKTQEYQRMLGDL